MQHTHRIKNTVSFTKSFLSLWQDVDIDLKKSNQESLLEAGCLLLIKEELPSPEAHSLYTRIRSLQRLKVRRLFLRTESRILTFMCFIDILSNCDRYFIVRKKTPHRVLRCLL